jgi:hypothetical protein
MTSWNRRIYEERFIVHLQTILLRDFCIHVSPFFAVSQCHSRLIGFTLLLPILFSCIGYSFFIIYLFDDLFLH